MEVVLSHSASQEQGAEVAREEYLVPHLLCGPSNPFNVKKDRSLLIVIGFKPKRKFPVKDPRETNLELGPCWKRCRAQVQATEAPNSVENWTLEMLLTEGWSSPVLRERDRHVIPFPEYMTHYLIDEPMIERGWFVQPTKRTR
jgi:hypothetical protein